MKVRLGHTTNSSSSSFIVAKRNDCTKEDIATLLKEKIDDFIKNELDYSDEYEDLVEEHGKTKAKKLVAEKIVNSIYDMGSMQLDNWKVESGECSSDGGLIESFMYTEGNIDSDKFKIGG
jgi:hypothetical protein